MRVGVGRLKRWGGGGGVELYKLPELTYCRCFEKLKWFGIVEQYYDKMQSYIKSLLGQVSNISYNLKIK